MTDILLITRSWNFAAQRHSNQRRKGEAQEPYVNHLAEVAELVATATEGKDANLIAAAVLHDTLEDTKTKLSELVALFNDDVARLVDEATDDKDLEKSERKRLQVVNAPKKTDRAKLLKLADKTSNLRSMANSPPKDWSLELQQEYLEWALKVAEGLRGVNPWLDARFDEAAERLRLTLR